jgi:hypothetical protein
MSSLRRVLIVRWQMYIKDYDGGTLMECYIHPAVDYLHVQDIVNRQRAFIIHVSSSIKQLRIVFVGIFSDFEWFYDHLYRLSHIADDKDAQSIPCRL